MKLLFDENLSPRLVRLSEVEFPSSVHIDEVNLRGASDSAIVEYAKQHGFVIISKDNDFRQRAFTTGPPPKIIWLSVGNAGTQRVAKLIESSTNRIRAFAENAEEALLVLKLSQSDD